MWNVKRTRPLSREAIKYLAILTMTCNHLALALLQTSPLRETLIDIGYFTAITMCWFLAEGYRYTHSVRNYALRLFVFGLLAEVPFCVVVGSFAFDMLFTLLACLGVLVVCDRVQNLSLRVTIILLLALFTEFCDWGVLPVAFVLLFRQSRGNFQREAAAFGIGALLQFFSVLIDFLASCAPAEALLHSVSASLPLMVSGLVILFLYNGKRSESHRAFHKWFFYVYYPAHLAVLAICKVLLAGTG